MDRIKEVRTTSAVPLRLVHSKSLTCSAHQKMSNLRVEADESHAKVIELQAKVKTLEQENLAREQEVTSLTHKNQVLEAEVEKLESGIKAAKLTADEGAQHGTHNEALQRKLQLLEEEAEGADKNLRETNEKYVSPIGKGLGSEQDTDQMVVAFVSPTSRPITTNARSQRWRVRMHSGRRSTRRWRRNTRMFRRSWRSSPRGWTISREAWLASGPMKPG